MKKLRLLIFGLLATLLTGCSLEDDRDVCCITIQFRYVINSEDRLTKDVRMMRHFLFDSDSIYIKEIYSSCDYSDNIKIGDLKVGKYILVSLGNVTERTLLSELVPGQSRLRDFSQGINSPCTRQTTDSFHNNGDELFYSVRAFEVSEEASDSYIADLSNIHCHLHVLATFDYSPRFDNDFSMRLYEVPGSYTLSPDSTRRILQQFDDAAITVPTVSNQVQLFPLGPQSLTQHIIDIMPYNSELEGEFITQRYTNQWAPILQVYNGDTPVTGRINLDRAFTYFGWYPDSDPAQDYMIKLVIHEDGSVDLDRWIRGRVSDWIDGGTITN